MSATVIRSLTLVRDSQLNKFAHTLTGNFNRRKDYLNFAGKKKIQKDMIIYNEKPITPECFSDSVFVQDPKGRRRRCALVITFEKVFVFEIKNWNLGFKINIESLSKISIPSDCCNFLCLHFGKKTLVIESFRRIEVVAYLSQLFVERRLPLFKANVCKDIEIAGDVERKKKEEAAKALHESQIKAVEDAVASAPTSEPYFKEGKEKGQKEAKDSKESSKKTKEPKDDGKKAKEIPFLQEAIRNARKSGFMKKLKKGLFNKTNFDEYFFLLTELGMVYFRKYEDEKSAGFLPLLGGTVEKAAKSVAGREHVLCVKVGKAEKFFQCYSDLEMEDWIKHIKIVQESAIGGKTTLKEMKKVL